MIFYLNSANDKASRLARITIDCANGYYYRRLF